MTDDPFEMPSATLRTAAFEKGPDRDGYGRPLVRDPRTGKVRGYTRATTLARTLADEYNLTEWQKRNVARGVALREDLTALAASTHPDDRATWDEITEAALEVSGARAGSRRGTALHQVTHRVNTGELPLDQVPAMFRADVTAYRAEMDRYRIGIGNLGTFSEVFTVAPEVESAGTADDVLECEDWGGRLRVGDLKTQKDHPEKYNAMEIAIQLAIYAHGLRDHGVWQPGPGGGSWSGGIPEIDLDVAVVMWLPVGQARCELIEIDIAAGWRYALAACQVRAWRKNKALCRPYQSVPAETADFYMGPSEESAALDSDGLSPVDTALGNTLASLDGVPAQPVADRIDKALPVEANAVYAFRATIPSRCKNCMEMGHVDCGAPVTHEQRVTTLTKQAAKDNAGKGRRKKAEIEGAAANINAVAYGCLCDIDLWTGEQRSLRPDCQLHIGHVPTEYLAGTTATFIIGSTDAQADAGHIVNGQGIVVKERGPEVHQALAEFSEPVVGPGQRAAVDAGEARREGASEPEKPAHFGISPETIERDRQAVLAELERINGHAPAPAADPFEVTITVNMPEPPTAVDPVIALRAKIRKCTTPEQLSDLWRADPGLFTPEIIELGKSTLAGVAKG